MQQESKQVPQHPSSAQRAVVLLLLERTDGLSRPELTAELDDLAQNALADALTTLTEEGVIATDEDRVQASRCARHLDALSLICV